MTPKPFEPWLRSDGAPGYLHGTKASLREGDLVEPGRASNYGERKAAAFVYLTGTLDAAVSLAERRTLLRLLEKLLRSD